MNIDLKTESICLTNTVERDISQIMEFERSNFPFIGEYTFAEHKNLLENDNCLHLSIRAIKEDKLVGHMILLGLTNEHQVIEFKRIAISEKGKGYGREAIQLLKKVCFEKLKYHRLWLDVFDDNPRAYRLYESEGFVQEGLLRENIKTDQGFKSLRIYSMLENEYPQKI